MSEDKNNQIIVAQINWSDQLASFSAQYNVPDLNMDDDIMASCDLFIDGNQLLQRWAAWQEESFSIATTGFSNGLNFLLTCLHFEQFLTANPDKPLKRLFFTHFEASPLSKGELQLALRQWPELSQYSALLLAQYPLIISGCHRLHVNSITLDLWFGDCHETLANLYVHQHGLFDCWFVAAPSENDKTNQYDQSFVHLIAKTAKEEATLLMMAQQDNLLHLCQQAGFTLGKQVSHTSKQAMLSGSLTQKQRFAPQGQHYRPSKASNNSKDIAIIGGGISSACLSLALIKRGYQVTLYCKDATLGLGASGNQQGALYPLLNQQHDALSELFSNSFLYARNYVQHVNKSHPFDFDLSGLLQLYYDENSSRKLDKILAANLPLALVEKLTAAQTDKLADIDIGQQALHYPLAGWLSPTQMVDAIFEKALQTGQLNIKTHHHLDAFEETTTGWCCHFGQHTVTHSLLVLTTAMKTLDFKQCEAIPLSAARGQVTHIKSTPGLQNLKLTLCHEGYLTPINKGFHCMGATFIRHNMDESFSQQEQSDNKNKLDKCIANKEWVEQIDCQHNHANIGIRCTTRDHFPYMGALPHYQNTKAFYQHADKKMPTDNAPFFKDLFILTGLGSRGLNTSPLLAETLASQINGEPLPLSMPILNAMQCNRQWVNYLKKGKSMKF